VGALEEAGVEVRDFTTEDTSLEDLFLHYAGEASDVAAPATEVGE